MKGESPDSTMHTVAILPWLELDEPVRVDQYELQPAANYRYVDLQEAEIVTAVITRHWELRNAIVHNPTLIKLADRQIADDLTEQEGDELFDFVDLLAFAGLSSRQFFNGPLGYCNRDVFQLYIYQFSSPSSGVTSSQRRRDGSVCASHDLTSYRADKPPHVRNTDGLEISFTLLESLVEVLHDVDYARRQNLLEAIQGFNQANTDRPDFREHIELVLIAGAFQRLLGVEHNVHKLVNEFMPLFTPAIEVAPCDCVRLTNTTLDKQREDKKNIRTIRESWLRDLYGMRGKYAHGQVDHDYPSLWSLENHLLLASFAFPLLVKLVLQDDGYYTLIDCDKFDIDLFESQACEEHFTELQDGEYPWETVRRRVWRQREFPWIDESEFN